MFILVDLTTSATPITMRPGPALPDLIEALDTYLAVFHDAWGKTVPRSSQFRIANGPGDRVGGDIAINFRDTIPEAPDALAYHTVTNGVPDIEVGVDLFTSLFDGERSLSGGVSHEVAEARGNLGANGWKDRQDGSGISDAEEMCDIVQNTGWSINGKVWVSNFLLPAYFIPGSEGPWDFLGVMKSRYDISNGYSIQATSPENITQVMGKHMRAVPHGLGTRVVYVAGEIRDYQKKQKKHPYSRTYRRGIRVV